ncbi:regulatory protein RecX [Cellvibrio mixtus]|nr:regulatory protein RecX [Cellvibrio mixtus]
MEVESPKLSDIRFAAMNFLAMREHSAKELKEKLGRKYSAWPQLLDAVIQALIEQNLQSDERFATAFIAMRQRQGKGSQLIRLELRERGISAELINACVDELDTQWQSLAYDARRKRFGNEMPQDQRERARQMRFLQARGFASRHIQQAFNTVDTDYC